jgi:hypothetical protein
MAIWLRTAVLFALSPFRIVGCLAAVLPTVAGLWFAAAVLVALFGWITGTGDRPNHVELVSITPSSTGERYEAARLVIRNPSNASYWKVMIACKSNQDGSGTTYQDMTGIGPYQIKQIDYRVDGEASNYQCEVSSLSGKPDDVPNMPTDVEVISSTVIGNVPVSQRI